MAVAGEKVAPDPALQFESVSVGVGGTMENKNDLFWVLARVSVEGKERLVLCLYRAESGGRHFNLADARMLDMDVQIKEMRPNQHHPTLRQIENMLKK